MSIGFGWKYLRRYYGRYLVSDTCKSASPCGPHFYRMPIAKSRARDYNHPPPSTTSVLQFKQKQKRIAKPWRDRWLCLNPWSLFSPSVPRGASLGTMLLLHLRYSHSSPIREAFQLSVDLNHTLFNPAIPMRLTLWFRDLWLKRKNLLLVKLRIMDCHRIDPFLCFLDVIYIGCAVEINAL